METFESDENNQLLNMGLGFLDVDREMDYILLMAYKARVAKYHNSKIHIREFIKGSLVIKRANGP